MTKVIMHPRCINCHPRNDIPRQGDEMAMQQPPVARNNGSGLGAPAMRRNTCHGTENADLVGVGGLESMPRHSPWQLAPASMDNPPVVREGRRMAESAGNFGISQR